MHNDKTHASYGFSWMRRAVEAQTAADRSKVGGRDELKSYLKAWLEKTSDVIGWWGVSSSFLPWNVVLIHHRNIQDSTLCLRKWPGTT